MSPIPGRFLERMPFSFMRDIDIMTPEEIESDPSKHQYNLPFGLKWEMGDVMLEPSGHMLLVTIQRETGRGPFERLVDMGAVPFIATPAQLSAHVAAETERWGRAVKFSGAKVD